MTTTQTVLVTGNTYPVKDQIKALGGRWDAAAKGWRVPADRAAEAQRLAGGATAAPRKIRSTTRGTWTGCRCGSVEEYERANDCASCRHDR